MTKYGVRAFLTEDNRHSAYLIEGLIELEKEGIISLQLSPMPLLIRNRWEWNGKAGKRSPKGYPWCPEIEVTQLETGKKLRIGIDLQDWANFYSYHALKNCDIIFKRAFDHALMDSIDPKLAKKIRPFGPNHACKVEDNRWQNTVKESRQIQTIVKIISEPGRALKKAMQVFTRKKLNTIHSDTNKTFEYKLKEPPDHDYIFFQVQCHIWHNHTHAKSLNDFRAQLIRNLRKEFGNQFIGGMFFKGQIAPDYLDCVTSVDPNPVNYRKFVQKASVVISTNGFGDSIPWKLTEYFQWGCCTVSQKNKHAFSVPIPDNTLEEFQTVEECVHICKRLLADKNKRSLMKKNSIEYYNRHIQPVASIQQAIEKAFLEKENLSPH